MNTGLIMISVRNKYTKMYKYKSNFSLIVTKRASRLNHIPNILDQKSYAQHVMNIRSNILQYINDQHWHFQEPGDGQCP